MGDRLAKKDDSSDERSFQYLRLDVSEALTDVHRTYHERADPMFEDLSHRFELASDDYARANGIDRDPEWFVLKLTEELGELVKAWNKLAGRGRTHGRSREALLQDLSDETADLLGHVLLFARANDVDLAAAIERKWRFNAV